MYCAVLHVEYGDHLLCIVLCYMWNMMITCCALCCATCGRGWSFVLYCVVQYGVEVCHFFSILVVLLVKKGGRLFCMLVVLHVVVGCIYSVLCCAIFDRGWSFVLYCVVIHEVEDGRLFCIVLGYTW